MLHKRPPTGWEQVDRVLVIQLGSPGDVVMTGPVLRTLRQALPGVRTTLMVSAAGSQIVPLMPWITDSFVPSGLCLTDEGLLPELTLQLIERLRSYRFDAAIILTGQAQSPYAFAYCCYLAGIPIRVGQSQEFGGGVLSHWVNGLSNAIHPIDRQLLLMEAAGFAIAGRQLELQVPASVWPQTQELLHRMEHEDLNHADIAAEVTAACLAWVKAATSVPQSARL